MKTLDLLERLTDLERRPNARKYTDAEYNLDGFRAWLDAIDAPYKRSSWIHVAGTKGKGSTSAMIESLLRAAGLHTGLFTSPHLEHYGQRFRFSGQSWTLEQFVEALSRIDPYIDTRPGNILGNISQDRTVFEVLTAIAFREFHAANVDVGILEVGLGGRLDCTNVIDPAVSVITPIGRDHTKILGEKIEQIALEKAGILKRGRPAAIFRPTTDLQRRAHATILDRARKLRVSVHQPPHVEILERQPGGQRLRIHLSDGPLDVRLNLAGDFQAQNFALALLAAQLYLRPFNLPLSREAIAAAARWVSWSGRFEVIPNVPPVVIDGAHCPLSASALADSLVSHATATPPPYTLLWGMQADKDHGAFLSALTDKISLGEVVCYPVPGDRGAPAFVLAAAARGLSLPVWAENDLESAFKRAQFTSTIFGGTLLAAGSIYTLSAIRKMAEVAKG